MLPLNLNSPCKNCGHALSRHTCWGEGICIDCNCLGWSPLQEDVDAFTSIQMQYQEPLVLVDPDTKLLGEDKPIIPTVDLNAPCYNCGHSLARHTASGEGLCLDCNCIGWVPVEVNRKDRFYNGDPWHADENDNVVRFFRGHLQVFKSPKNNTPYAQYWPGPKTIQWILDALNEFEKTHPLQDSVND